MTIVVHCSTAPTWKITLEINFTTSSPFFFSFLAKKVLNLLKCDSMKVQILCYNTCLKPNYICFFFFFIDSKVLKKISVSDIIANISVWVHCCFCARSVETLVVIFKWRFLLFAAFSMGSVFYFIVFKFQIPVRASLFQSNVSEKHFLVLAASLPHH